MKRRLGIVAVILIVCGVLYLPVRRELLDFGVIPAGTFRDQKGTTLTLYANRKYQMLQGGQLRTGSYTTEKFAEAPWIASIHLDSGLALYVPYQDHIFRIEDATVLTGAEIKLDKR